MAFGAIVAASRLNREHLTIVQHHATTARDKDYFAGSVVGVEAYAGTRLQTTFHDAVLAIEEHPCEGIFLATFEVGDALFSYVIELNKHTLNHYFVNFTSTSLKQR